MRKQPEVEDSIRWAIRDQLALRPLLSTRQLQLMVYKAGFHSANGGMLDWHYVAKLTNKVRVENIAKLSNENRLSRLAKIKERHRRLTEQLAEIAAGQRLPSGDKYVYPSARDRVAAADTIMKWDMALLFAEEQFEAIDQQESSEDQEPKLLNGAPRRFRKLSFSVTKERKSLTVED